jgi:hypothetical protein
MNTIVCLNVLEHIEDDLAALWNIDAGVGDWAIGESQRTTPRESDQSLKGG